MILTQKLVDTRPPSIGEIAKHATEKQYPSMYQCFIGQVLYFDEPINAETENALCSLSHAWIMKGLRPYEQGVAFDYILPLSPHLVLVEFTAFTPSVINKDALAANLSNFVSQHLKSAEHSISFSVCREEFGVLPMVNFDKNQHYSEPTASKRIYGGIIGGAMRASTGYSFLNSLRWAQNVAHGLCQYGKLTHCDPIPKHYRLMDDIMLRVLQKNPELACHLFYRFANRLSSTSYARFMTEKATLLDIVKVILAMPKWPFLKSFLSKIYANYQ